MQTAGSVEEQIAKQAILAGEAQKSISAIGDEPSARQLVPKAVLDLLAPYSVTHIADRVINADTFDFNLVRALHSRIAPLESMVNKVLIGARKRLYFDDISLAEPLRWLEKCDEQVKDCLAALEAMLDPHLDEIISESIAEYSRGETVSLDRLD